MQQDPIGDGMNWYAYALDNPVYWIDPEGLWEVGGEVYEGIGGGIYFGVDPCTGWFFKIRAGVGWGIAGGWLPDFDPWARSKGAEAGFTDSGSFFGFDVGAGVGVLGMGPVGGIAGGWASDARGNLARYPRRPEYPLLGGLPGYGGLKFGGGGSFRVGATAAIEGGFY